MKRRGMDRAQRLRAHRAWWARNGAFMRGLMVGVALTIAAVWIARALVQSG
jgi:hypothetical protein